MSAVVVFVVILFKDVVTRKQNAVGFLSADDRGQIFVAGEISRLSKNETNDYRRIQRNRSCGVQ